MILVNAAALSCNLKQSETVSNVHYICHLFRTTTEGCRAPGTWKGAWQTKRVKQVAMAGVVEAIVPRYSGEEETTTILTTSLLTYTHSSAHFLFTAELNTLWEKVGSV